MRRIGSLNEGEAGRQASENFRSRFAAFRLSQCTGINRYLLSLVMIPTSRSASFKALMSLWFFFFSDFESFSGTGHILSRENFTYSWSPICTLISSSPSSTDRQLFPCASLYGTYLMTLSLPVHCDAHHKRHAYKGGALEVTVQPPKRTTNCRRLRASNRLYLPYFCVSWLWHENLHDP